MTAVPGREWQARWTEYRGIRRCAYLPLMVFLLGILGAIAAPVLQVEAAVLGALPVLVVYGSGLTRWPCPRCGKPFHSTRWGYNAFARRCLNCGLPRWADPSAP
jgi:hypothetical protein